jgi:hypothetical protein
MIYELSVKSFCDGNADGSAISGLCDKLDYLQRLGWHLVAAVLSSAERRRGDIADYVNVPGYGTLEDFKRFRRRHERVRVIELVLNHIRSVSMVPAGGYAARLTGRDSYAERHRPALSAGADHPSTPSAPTDVDPWRRRTTGAVLHHSRTRITVTAVVREMLPCSTCSTWS